MDSTFKRGDITWFKDAASDSSDKVMHGNRPVIIVSPNDRNQTRNTVVVVPLTTNYSRQLYPGQFYIRMSGVLSKVCCDQIRVVDKNNLDIPHGRIGREVEARLDEALQCVVGLCGDTTEATLVNDYTEIIPK